MNTADTVVLLLPAGNSAHLEFGLACAVSIIGGMNRRMETAIVLDPMTIRPDLMYGLADMITDNFDELAEAMRGSLKVWAHIHCPDSER